MIDTAYAWSVRRYATTIRRPKRSRDRYGAIDAEYSSMRRLMVSAVSAATTAAPPSQSTSIAASCEAPGEHDRREADRRPGTQAVRHRRHAGHQAEGDHADEHRHDRHGPGAQIGARHPAILDPVTGGDAVDPFGTAAVAARCRRDCADRRPARRAISISSGSSAR